LTRKYSPQKLTVNCRPANKASENQKIEKDCIFFCLIDDRDRLAVQVIDKESFMFTYLLLHRLTINSCFVILNELSFSADPV
jgi:hypothetical protein